MKRIKSFLWELCCCLLLPLVLQVIADHPEYGVRRIQRELREEYDSLPQDATDIEELRTVVGEQVGYYNNDRRHSSIGYEIPREYTERMAERRGE